MVIKIEIIKIREETLIMNAIFSLNETKGEIYISKRLLHDFHYS